jgi:hypothetical protein
LELGLRLLDQLLPFRLCGVTSLFFGSQRHSHPRSGFFRLIVYAAYLPPIPDFAQNFANLSLQYEGRAAKIG